MLICASCSVAAYRHPFIAAGLVAIAFDQAQRLRINFLRAVAPSITLYRKVPVDGFDRLRAGSLCWAAAAFRSNVRPRMRQTSASGRELKTLFLQAPSFEGFDGGAGSRYQAKREIHSFWRDAAQSADDAAPVARGSGVLPLPAHS
jgi:hypothetical protein